MTRIGGIIVDGGRKVITTKKDWGTPRIYVDAVRKVFGGKICLDPCSGPHSIVDADVEFMLPKNDGLKEEWDYPKIYMNPPYGVDQMRGTRISDWLSKCVETRAEFGSEIQALVPVAPNTSHWKRYVFGRSDAVCFLYDTRLKFLVNGRDGGKGAPMACAMIYYGGNKKRFFSVFGKHGAVLDLQNLKRRGGS